MPRWNRFLSLLSVTVILAQSTFSFAQLQSNGLQGASVWTDVTGSYRVEATFVRLDQQNVVLKKADGKEVSVPLNKLSEASRKQAMSAASALNEKVAPNPSTPDFNSGLEQGASQTAISIPSGMDAKQAVDFLFQHVKDGKWIVVWDWLPTKSQSDLENIVKLTTQKYDPELLKPVQQVTSDIIKVLRTKKTFVLGTPMVKEALKEDYELTSTCYDPMVDLLEAYCSSDMMNAEKLKSGKLRTALDAYLTQIAKKAAALQASVPPDSPSFAKLKSMSWDAIQYEVESTSDSGATLIIKRENSPEFRTELVKFEDRWLPKAMVEGWEERRTQVMKELNELTPAKMAQTKQAMQIPVIMIGGVINGFMSAQDQASFDEVFNGIMPMIAMMGGGMPMPGMPVPGDNAIPAN